MCVFFVRRDGGFLKRVAWGGFSREEEEEEEQNGGYIEAHTLREKGTVCDPRCWRALARHASGGNSRRNNLTISARTEQAGAVARRY